MKNPDKAHKIIEFLKSELGSTFDESWYAKWVEAAILKILEGDDDDGPR